MMLNSACDAAGQGASHAADAHDAARRSANSFDAADAHRTAIAQLVLGAVTDATLVSNPDF